MKRSLLIVLSVLAANAVGNETTLIDPTQPSGSSLSPLIAASDTPTRWQLSATQITPRKRLAIINGTQVTEGGAIGNARVLHISHAQVRLDAQGEIITLRLLQSEVKKTR